MFEYQVIIYQESALSAFIPGGGKVDPVNFSQHLNSFAKKGWRVVAIEKEMRRTLFFRAREAFICILERAVPPMATAAPPLTNPA